MSVTLRDILGKVRLNRPDVREAEIDYLIQETARKVCRQTMLLRETQTVLVNGPATGFTVTPLTASDINRFHLVRIIDTYTATPAAPTVSATTGGSYANNTTLQYKIEAVDQNGFTSVASAASIQVTTASSGAATINFGALPTPPQSRPFLGWKVFVSVNGAAYKELTTLNGGLISSPFTPAALLTGGNYIGTDKGAETADTTSLPLSYPTGDYRTLEQYNDQAVYDWYVKPDSAFSLPQGWTYAGNNQIHLWPPLAYGSNFYIQCTYSIIPQGEISSIAFPVEVEECIRYGALARAYELPGPNQNLQQAQRYEVKHNGEIANLKAVAELGQSGRLRVMPRTLGGRGVFLGYVRWGI